MSQTKSWYYANGNNAEGPYSENELRDLFKNGVINRDTYIVNNLTMHEWEKYSDCIPIPELPKRPEPLSIPPIKSNSSSPSGPTPPAFKHQKSLLEEETETVVIPVNDYQRPTSSPKPTAKPTDTNQKPAPPKQSDKPIDINISVNKDELAKKLKNIDIKNGVNVGGRTFNNKTVITAVVSLVTLFLMFMNFFKLTVLYESTTATLFEMSDVFKTLGSLGDSLELKMISYLAVAIPLLHIVALVLYLLNSKKNRYFSISAEFVTIVVLFIYYMCVKTNCEDLFIPVSLTFPGILCCVGCIATVICYAGKEKQ